MLLLSIFAAMILGGLLYKELGSVAWSCGIASVIATLLIYLVSSNHFGWMDATFFKNLAILGISNVASSFIACLFLKKKRASQRDVR